MKGLETTIGVTLPVQSKTSIDRTLFAGFVQLIGNYSEEDAVLITVLYEAGAVPFVRTNIPQTLMVSFTDGRFSIRTKINEFAR